MSRGPEPAAARLDTSELRPGSRSATTSAPLSFPATFGGLSPGHGPSGRGKLGFEA